MARLSLLLLAFVVVFATLSVADDIDSYPEAGFYGSRLRRVDAMAFHGENAYLQQLLSNLKPRFRRSL